MPAPALAGLLALVVDRASGAPLALRLALPAP